MFVLAAARDLLQDKVYAEAVARLVPRIARLQEALRKAGDTDAVCAATWRHLVNRRATNMLLFASDLRSTGDLRADLTDQEVADHLCPAIRPCRLNWLDGSL